MTRHLRRKSVKRRGKSANGPIEQIEKMNVRIRELDEQLELADEIGNSELAESIWRERQLLGDLWDDLGAISFRKDFFEIRDVIEAIVGTFE